MGKSEQKTIFVILRKLHLKNSFECDFLSDKVQFFNKKKISV